MVYNCKHQSMIYKVEDCVWLSIRNLDQQRLSKKLLNKYIDLYTVLSLIKRQAYQLNLKNSMKHDIFHVLLLKSVKGCFWEPLKPILMKSEKEWLIDFIVDKCVCGRKCITQYWVQWKEYGSHKNTWELLKHLRNVRDYMVIYESWFGDRAVTQKWMTSLRF